MPVARIYTRFAEEAAPLIGRLRARGYTIEIVDPGHFRVTPADLEVELERLATPEALASAARFARERDAEVFVAAGLPLDEAAAQALRGAAAPRGNALREGLKRLIAPFRRLGAEVHAGRKARRQRNLDVELAKETEREQLAEQKAAARAERARREQEAAERERVEQEAAQARRREEEARRARERETELARQREEAERRRVAQAAREREEESAREQRAERERRYQEDARRRAAELAALQEAKRRNAGLARLAAGGPAAARRDQAAHGAAARYAGESRMARATKRGFAAAAGLATLVALGWGAYQNRTPAAPLSNQQRVRGEAIQQDVPFGAATIKPQPRTTAAPKAAPQQKAAEQKPAPAGAPKPAPKRTRRYAADDVDMVAEDEIVYHGAPKNSKSRASASQPQQKDGVKRISDLEDGEEE